MWSDHILVYLGPAQPELLGLGQGLAQRVRVVGRSGLAEGPSAGLLRDQRVLEGRRLGEGVDR